jgi:pyrroline-5-carboxylate reductase
MAKRSVVLLFRFGNCSLTDEKLMDAATVLAASGTAFALRYIRASIRSQPDRNGI